MAQARWQQTFTVGASDQLSFQTLSGDLNPLHSDECVARRAGFQGPIVFGGLIVAKISGFLGTIFPGAGCVWTQLAIDFRKPLYLNQTAHLVVEETYGNTDLQIWDLSILIYVDPASPLARGSVRVSRRSECSE